MTDNLESLILEHLKHIRAKVDRNELDMRDIKLRMTSIEHQVASFHTDMALIDARIDRMENRLEQIESRLELTQWSASMGAFPKLNNMQHCVQMRVDLAQVFDPA